jgi:hypothetical protein
MVVLTHMRNKALFGALLAVVPLAACGQAYGGGTGAGGTQEGIPLDAEVIDFQEDGFADRQGGAISDTPIDPVEVFGRDGSAPDPVGDGVTYVAVSSLSGCYTAKGAELHREGDNLRVKFDIDKPPPPDDTIQCIRSFEPYVQFAVDSDAVEGVKTIDGKPPL